MEAILHKALKSLSEDSNTSVIPLYFSPNYTAYNGGKNFFGYSFIKQWVHLFNSTLNKPKIVSIEIIITTDNEIVWERKLSAIHVRDKWGIKASGNKIVWTEMLVTKFENQKIVSERIVSEFIGQLLKQTNA